MPTKVNVELEGKVQFGIKEMCEDYWRCQSNNPDGYVSDMDDAALTLVIYMNIL